jgi:hypothetical protein
MYPVRQALTCAAAPHNTRACQKTKKKNLKCIFSTKKLARRSRAYGPRLSKKTKKNNNENACFF